MRRGKGSCILSAGNLQRRGSVPGYTISIDKIPLNNSPYQLNGKEFTTSDDKHCTRVNLYNAWVNDLPKEVRTPDGDFTDCSAQIMDISDKTSVSNISITFTGHEP